MNSKEENESIIEESNYILSNIKKEEIEDNCYIASINSLLNINSRFNDYLIAFNKDGKEQELLKINNYNPKLIIDFFKDPKNKKSIKELKKLGFNPATIMITISLAEIEKDLNEIKEISKSILSFLEKDKKSEIEADVKTLNRIIIDYKYNWEDEQYINNNYNQVLNIKRTAVKNIDFYQKEIHTEIQKTSIFKTNKIIGSIQKELEKDFSYYRLSLYVYGFSTFMEVMLLENFNKEYLTNKKEELDTLSKEYTSHYDNAYTFIKKEANKSVQGNLISGIGAAEKTIGGLAEKVQVIKNKNIDTWFNQQGDNLQNKGQDMKAQFSTKFEEMKQANIEIFTHKIELIEKLFNNTKNIYFDKEKIYLEMVK